MTETVRIASRFHGPPDSGNGGYVCGLLARRIEGPAEVKLRLPPPLDRNLALERLARGIVVLRDGGTVVAQARPAPLDLEVPAPPTFGAAVDAATRFAGFADHWFPDCFVCGPVRAPGDGLRIFPGPLAGTALVAAPWRPDLSLADGTGRVRDELVWAALDCPGAFAVTPPKDKAIVLGLFAARLETPLAAGEPAVVIAWPIGAEGRKHWAGSAVFTAAGRLGGVARATWIEIDRPR